MLELRNITKDYVSGDNITHALRGISVNFRKNEFVSILGASGCGKTTTLNIIGGLDRYTDGDLLINGVSTKEFKDRDWDTYRNHSIGFVFQTYNLISHQNILKNVELALTISGVSKEERREKAYQALKIVGLEGMEKKKPNQLSGGQCQRVAIARALINNPEILLADEPTGALDSETSIQIMDLLKEVATDRLVIMVTHNPDLANAYSTRIIRMSDGLLISDSNPYEGVKDKKTEKVENSQEKPGKSAKKVEKNERDLSKGKKKQTSMSLLTSIGLSTSNLLSKMRRTVLVTIAGSIGIIGVSAVLGVSRGVKDYIGGMQNDMLSAYPIGVAEESVDYTSLMTGLTSSKELTNKWEFNPDDPAVGINSMIEYLMSAYSDFTKVKTNIIDDNLLAYIEQVPKSAAAVTKYNYGIDPTNNIFGTWKANKDDPGKVYSLNGLTQSYIQELKTVQGFDEYATYVNLFTSFMKEMPDSKEYILDQYDVIAGEEPSLNENDLVFVVDKDTTLTDVVLAEMGVFNHDEFLNIAIRAIDVQQVKNDDTLSEAEKNAKINQIINDTYYTEQFKYNELLSKTYTYYPQNKIYKNGEIQTETISASLISTSPVMSMITMEYNDYSDIISVSYRTMSNMDSIMYPIKLDLTRVTPEEYPDKPEFNAKGTWTGEYVNKDETVSTYTLTVPKMGRCTLNIDGTNIRMYDLDNPYGHAFSYETFTGYNYNAEVQPSYGKGTEMKVKSILRLKDSKQFGCLSSGIYYSSKFAEKYMKDSKPYQSGTKKNVTKALCDYIGTAEENSAAFDAYVTFEYQDHKKLDSDGNATTQIGCASSLNGDLSSSFSDLFSSLTGTNNLSVDSTHLRSLSGLKANVPYKEDSDEIDTENITFDKIPQEISIYPRSFDDKDVITDHLDRWNAEGSITVEVKGEKRTLAKEERQQLTYTDTISLIAAVIDTFINAITIALVVFTSLSLVVSCFMIAVITYISVVERIKEIGVIRSLGGRKRDVASLFVVETLMTGLFSGVFGIVMTYILELIVNLILKSLFGIAIMNLTIPTALLMIGISIFLSVMSGLIPSGSAARKDPVIALRSNE